MQMFQKCLRSETSQKCLCLSVMPLTVSARVSLALTEEAVLRPRPGPRAELRDVRPRVLRHIATVESPGHWNSDIIIISTLFIYNLLENIKCAFFHLH